MNMFHTFIYYDIFENCLTNSLANGRKVTKF